MIFSKTFDDATRAAAAATGNARLVKYFAGKLTKTLAPSAVRTGEVSKVSSKSG